MSDLTLQGGLVPGPDNRCAIPKLAAGVLYFQHAVMASALRYGVHYSLACFGAMFVRSHCAWYLWLVVVQAKNHLIVLPSV